MMSLRYPWMNNIPSINYSWTANGDLDSNFFYNTFKESFGWDEKKKPETATEIRAIEEERRKEKKMVKVNPGDFKDFELKIDPGKVTSRYGTIWSDDPQMITADDIVSNGDMSNVNEIKVNTLDKKITVKEDGSLVFSGIKIRQRMKPELKKFYLSIKKFYEKAYPHLFDDNYNPCFAKAPGNAIMEGATFGSSFGSSHDLVLEFKRIIKEDKYSQLDK